MLTDSQRTLVKTTIPVLQEHGVTLMEHFYARIFVHNPEMRETFNQGNQRSGAQQQALSGAVLAYAQHIDNPGVLMPVLERVANKHVSLGIRAEHYQIIGGHLLASIGEVLGAAASPELIDAWAAAYGQLADLLIDMEQAIYTRVSQEPGGWTGWRTFRVRNTQVESEEITSFELVPGDGGKVPQYRPGQYISVRVIVPELGYRQPRQYSLSDAPGKDCLRISVKREANHAANLKGMVSNHLHDALQEGTLIEVAPPAGDFYLHEDRHTPVVLLSAGVGITPMISILEHLANTAPERPIRFIHAARHAGVQAFSRRIETLIKGLKNAASWIAHEAETPAHSHIQRDTIGRLDVAQLMQNSFLPADADYYICGPIGFMRAQIQALRQHGIAQQRIHAEAFGTGGVAA